MQLRYIKILVIVMVFVVSFLGYYRRTIYTFGQTSITVWSPIFWPKSYLIFGKYYSLTPPKEDFILVYASKNIYVGWAKSNEVPCMYVGSVIIKQVGFKQVTFLTHNDFFKKYTGQEYLNGVIIIDSNFVKKKSNYHIQFIEL